MGRKHRRQSSFEDDVPNIGGYYLVLGQLRIQNLYKGATPTNPCGSGDVDLIEECFVIETQQKHRFVTLQILNQPICPILCALVKEYVGGKFVGWKMVGSGGNTSSQYNFDIIRESRGKVREIEYYFTDGYNNPGSPLFPNGLATTGYGTAKRIHKSEVPELIKKYPGGACTT